MISKKSTLIIIAACGIIAACSDSHSSPIEKSQKEGALTIALTPTMGNMPFFYAYETGIFDSLGLSFNLHSHNSQLDVDTALLGGSSIGGSSDKIRHNLYTAEKKGVTLTPIMTIPEQWYVITCGKLRIKTAKDLRKRTVAGDRFSAADELCRAYLSQKELPYSICYHPQINSLNLRTTMLNGDQIDAAMLPEPYATWAQTLGHRTLISPQSDTPEYGILLLQDSLCKKGYDKKIINAYNIAKKQMRTKAGQAIIDSILVNCWHLPQSAIDSLNNKNKKTH